MKTRLNNLLKNELLCSMGCTEPSAIAFAAAFSKEHLIGDEPIKKIKLQKINKYKMPEYNYPYT